MTDASRCCYRLCLKHKFLASNCLQGFPNFEASGLDFRRKKLKTYKRAFVSCNKLLLELRIFYICSCCKASFAVRFWIPTHKQLQTGWIINRFIQKPLNLPFPTELNFASDYNCAQTVRAHSLLMNSLRNISIWKKFPIWVVNSALKGFRWFSFIGQQIICTYLLLQPQPEKCMVKQDESKKVK